MKDADLYTIEELQEYINNVYERAKSLASNDGVYESLSTCFVDTKSKLHDVPHCFVDYSGYNYRYTERGLVIKNIVTRSLFEISYQIIKPDIFNMAVNYERKHRVGCKDSRRVIFSKLLQYFGAMGDNYKKRAKVDIIEVLQTHPFQDELY